MQFSWLPPIMLHPTGARRSLDRTRRCSVWLLHNGLKELEHVA